MTCIAWDGKTLAADKRSSDGTFPMTTTKIAKTECGALLGASGDSAVCRELRRWWIEGHLPDKFPQKGADATLLVITRDGCIQMHWGSPVPVEIEDKFTAIGSGRDFALAAMHYGRSAREAVELACKYDTGCGNGIDALTLD